MMRRMTACAGLVLCAAFGVGARPAQAQIRVATWNLTEYDGAAARTAAFQTSIFGTFSGRSMSPDVIVIQEVESAGAATTFLNLLNSASGSSGTWAQATFFNGPDSDSQCYYRTDRLDLLGTVVAVTGTGFPIERHIMRYQLRPDGFTSAGASFYLFSCHLKASNTTTDADQRNQEAAAWRAAAETLPAGSNFIFTGDYNFYGTGAVSEPAWGTLTNSTGNNNGRVFDPINKYSGWGGSSNSAVHTQSPTSSWGGMDDRFDMLLVSASLINGSGLDYIGNPNVAMTTNWNDPNHSYRVWGNDGASYNTTIRIADNAMVGSTIAQALIDHFAGTSSAPHLPVFLDLFAPAKGAAPAMIDFGTVSVGATAQQQLTITNATPLTFSRSGSAAGIDMLTYTFAASSGFTAPAGTFNEAAGGGANMHVITMSTATPGVKNGMITINSDDPDVPSRVVMLTGVVMSASFDYDVNNDGLEDMADVYDWMQLMTDVDGSGSANATDLALLRAHIRDGEPQTMVNARR
jgi:endonuclease/exonuclease/phosphatase family metal-dependent hydrolase